MIWQDSAARIGEGLMAKNIPIEGEPLKRFRISYWGNPVGNYDTGWNLTPDETARCFAL
jgi:hypothetical protein